MTLAARFTLLATSPSSGDSLMNMGKRLRTGKYSPRESQVIMLLLRYHQETKLHLWQYATNVRYNVQWSPSLRALYEKASFYKGHKFLAASTINVPSQERTLQSEGVSLLDGGQSYILLLLLQDFMHIYIYMLRKVVTFLKVLLHCNCRTKIYRDQDFVTLIHHITFLSSMHY